MNATKEFYSNMTAYAYMQDLNESEIKQHTLKYHHHHRSELLAR